MRKATKADFKNAVRIISRSFATNPSILWVIKRDNKQDRRIRALAKYSFNSALKRRGAYLSSNEKGIALCYLANSKEPPPLIEYLYQLELVFRAVGLFRIGKVLKREAYVKSQQPKGEDFLYFWFYGVEPGFNGMGDAKEMKDEVFRMADEMNLPIYVETSVEKNKRVYMRYGFELYHTWWVEEQGINLYFLRRVARNS